MATELRVDGVSASYGRTEVLHDLTFASVGSVIGLLGPNGAGKTTLLSIVTGSRRATRGTVAIAGHPVDATRLGFLPQGLRPPGGYTCGDFLRYVAWLRRVSPKRTDELVDGALSKVGLGGRSSIKIRLLSGGQRQRLGLAQALVNEPDLLVLDEPTVGLDPEQRRQFLDLLSGLGAERFVVMATHITDDVASVCDQVVVLDGGRVRFVGSVSELCMTSAGSPSVSATSIEAGYLAILESGRQHAGTS